MLTSVFDCLHLHFNTCAKHYFNEQLLIYGYKATTKKPRIFLSFAKWQGFSYQVAGVFHPHYTNHPKTPLYLCGVIQKNSFYDAKMQAKVYG